MSFPTTSSPDRLLVRSLQPARVSVTHSLKRQVRGGSVQRWGFRLEYSNRSRAEMAELMAHAISQRGQYGSFTFVPAVLGQPQSAVSGTPLASGATASGRSISTDGWANSVTAMKAGEFVKFNGHNKVYMLTADVVTDGSGQATLSIEPALYADVADNEPLVVSNVPFTVAYAAPQHEWSLAGGPVLDWACDLEEVL